MSGFTGHMFGIVTRDRLNRPDAVLVSLEALDMEHDGIDATRVTVADVPTLASGPNAGKPNWKRKTNVAQLYLLPGEVQAWLAEHPEVCGECANKRELFVSYTAENGTTMRPCPDCADPAHPSRTASSEATAEPTADTLFGARA
jgi:hypothetical protein